MELAAERCSGQLVSPVGQDQSKLITAPGGHDVKDDISGAFARSARLDADGLVGFRLPQVGDRVRSRALLGRT